MRWGLRYQLLAPMALLIPAPVGVCTWTAMDSAALARRRIANQLDSVATTMIAPSFVFTEHILKMMSGLSGAEYLVIDAGGGRLATFEGTTDELPKPQPPRDPLGDQIHVAGQAYFCRGVPIKEGSNAGSVLYILYPKVSLDEAIRDSVRPTLVLGVSGALAAMVLMLVAGQRLVRRIREFERRTRQVAAGDFSPMPLPPQNDELQDLAKSVNEMAEKLSQLQQAVMRSERARILGQVSGGLAHQLRNGVTGAKLALQLHAQSCDGGDREALQVAERQLTRMATDLQRFFDIGRTGVTHKSCSIRDLIEEAVKLLRPQCRHAGIDLIWEPPASDVRIVGHAGQLGHAIMNLLGNAVEAVGSQGSVEIRLSSSPDAVIQVIDTGPGPDEKIADSIFEPLVTGRPEGIGLGLAVAKQVVEEHGGRIHWQRQDDKTWFQVELPTKN